MAKKKNYDQFVDAICEGDLEAIQAFLDEGFDPNGDEQRRDYNRPLNHALINQQFQAAERLYQAGAQPRYASAFLSQYLDQPEYAEWIERIIADASPKFRENYESAFTSAVESGNREMAEKLWPTCPEPSQFTSRRTPLCEAIRTEQEEMALWMIELGFDHSCRNENETPPVLLAVIADQPRVLQKLFELGASPDIRVHGHQTVLLPGPPLYKKLRHVRDYPKNKKFEVFHEGSLLHAAAVTGSAHCAKILLDAGLDPDEEDSEGRTPAMLASLGGDATRDVLELLPEPDLGSGPALRDLLTRSLINEDPQGLKKAIEHGADVSQKIESDYSTESTPLIIAACKGNVEMIQILLDAGADIEQVDWPQGQKRDLGGLKFLLEQSGFDSLIGMPMTSARSPLGWAALYGQIEAMKCLLEAGADKQATDVFGFTALHLAAIGDNAPTVAYVCEIGLDPNAEGFDGYTPLHAAAVANSVKAIPILVEAGANTTRKNKGGETPVVVAREFGKPGVRNKLEPHTPKEFQKKQKTKKKMEPDWEWNRAEFEKLLKEVRKSHGKEAKKLATKKFRDQLAKAAKEKSFLTAAEDVRKKLKGEELSTWDETPHLYWTEGVKLTDAKLLKVQSEFLDKGVFVVRQLSSIEETWRVYIVPTTDLFELIGAFGTNGVNMGLDPDLTLAWLMHLYERHPYRIIGLMHDGLEFRFDASIKQPNDLVQELMIACPPEMDENKHRKHLRKKLKSQTPQVFLWWD